MASLQTLRNKGGVIVAVVIGLALLAFLLGDLLTSGNSLFTSRNVGEIGGSNVSAQQYQEKVNYLTDMSAISSGNSAMTTEQSEQIQNQAWESFVRNEGFKPQAEKLGLITANGTISELFFGQYPSQIVTGMFTNPQTGTFDPQYLQSFINNVEQGGDPNMSRFLSYLQSEVADQNVMSLYKTMVDRASYATGLEAEMAVELNGGNYNIEYVLKPYTDIADSTVKVSESEIKSYYDAHKSAFKQNVSRAISYVMFEALPSNDDFRLAAQAVESMAGELAKTENPMQYAQANTQGQLDERYYAIDELSGDKAAYAFGGDASIVYGPVQNGNQFTVSRIVGKKVVADSMELSQIVLSGTDKAKADSIVDALSKGADFATLVNQYTLDEQSKAEGGKVGKVDPQTLIAQFASELVGAKSGQVKLVVLPQSIHVIKIGSVIGEKERVQLATINYTVEPSVATRNAAYARASAFKAVAGKNANDFTKAVSDSALVARRAVIASNQREVQGISDSREIITWAYNKGEKEGVSQVMTFGDNLVVAALAEISEDKISPLKKVSKQIENILITKKKGEMLSSEFAGKSIEALASQGMKVDSASAINFSSYMIGSTGFDPVVGGAVGALANGATSKPIVGMQGVYMVRVVNVTKNEGNKDIERSRLQAEGEQSAFAMAYTAFIDGLNIEDVRYKYF